MVDELDKSIRVHQALHGYADGHRLLACSTTLKARDQKTMLVMSDVSGAGASLDTDGYLTGYPLPDSGVYAVARTWAATELARPGCVWTHTILVDFADLANLPSMSFLDAVFRQPVVGFQQLDYTGSLTVERLDDEKPMSVVTRDSLKRILAALYGHPKDKVLSAATEAASQVVFAVWAQQWPRLRRTFRFCTTSFADRSTEGASFDLQFTPLHDRSYRSRFVDVVDADRTSFPPYLWLEDAVQDISSGKDGALRKFLKDVGGDIAGGREMFGPLCSLHTMIPRFGTGSESIDHAISLIDTSFDLTSAGSLRALLVSAVARHPENLNDRSADFLLKHLDLLSRGELLDDANELGSAIWRFKPEQLMRLVADGTPLSDFAESTIKHLDASLLIEAAAYDCALVPQILRLRPDLLSGTEIWSVGGDWVHDVLRGSAKDSAAIVRNILLAGRSDLAQHTVDAFGASRVLQLLSGIVESEPNEAVRNSLPVWFDISVRKAIPVAEFLISQSKKNASVLLAIAKRSYPDFVPNEIGTDPWATAIKNVSGRLNEGGQQYLAGYLLARAFGYRSHSQVELIEFAFDEVYFGAFNDRLAEEAWQFLERSLPRSWWADWDHCQRLRNAVTDMFVNRDLAPEGFTRITRDNSLFTELSRLAAHNSRGRKYLKRVLRFLKDSGGSDGRIRIIEDAI